MAPAEVIGDAIRLHLNPTGLPWDRLALAEQGKWRGVGDAALVALWKLDI